MISQPESQKIGKTGSSDAGYLVPKGATLESFSSFVTAEKGVCLADLAAMTQIRLQTTNSEYLITILDPSTARVWVQGGRFLPTRTEAILWGASLGGAFLRAGMIGIGLQLELAFETQEGTVQKLTTSPVDHLFIDQHPAEVGADLVPGISDDVESA
ncbi:MAG: hypothetical protein ACOYNR_11225 [Blastocatellia bacterium]